MGEFSRRFEREPAPFLRLYSLAFLLFLYLPVALVILLRSTRRPSGLPLSRIDDTLVHRRLQQLCCQGERSRPAFRLRAAVGFSLLIGIPCRRSAGSNTGLRPKSQTRRSLVALAGPPLVLGLGIIGLNALGIQRNFWFVVAGHTLLVLPIVVLIIMARLEGLDQNQELAAMDLGAPPWRALLSVTVPQALPAIIAAAMLGFAISLDEFIMTFHYQHDNHAAALHTAARASKLIPLRRDRRSSPALLPVAFAPCRVSRWGCSGPARTQRAQGARRPRRHPSRYRAASNLRRAIPDCHPHSVVSFASVTEAKTIMRSAPRTMVSILRSARANSLRSWAQAAAARRPRYESSAVSSNPPGARSRSAART